MPDQDAKHWDRKRKVVAVDQGVDREADRMPPWSQIILKLLAGVAGLVFFPIAALALWLWDAPVHFLNRVNEFQQRNKN